MHARVPPVHHDGTLRDVHTLAFDLDATLVDILTVKRRGARAAAAHLHRLGHAADPDACAKDLFAFALRTGIDRPDVVEAYVDAHAPHVHPRDAAAARRAFEAAEDAACEPYDGVPATLTLLRRRGYRLLLITDAPRRQAIRRLRAAGLVDYFGELVTGDDTPHGKADPRPYRLALRRLGADADGVLMVGDNPRRDVAVAQQAGLRAVLATRGFQPDLPDARWPAHPDAVVEDVAHLPALLRPRRTPATVAADRGRFDAASNGRTQGLGGLPPVPSTWPEPA